MANRISRWTRMKMTTGGRKVKKDTENLGYWTYPERGQDLGSRENSELSAKISRVWGEMARKVS